MIDYDKILKNEETLDPINWNDYKELTHKMADNIFIFLQTVGEKPVGQNHQNQ